jgi:hypothetical protein
MGQLKLVISLLLLSLAFSINAQDVDLYVVNIKGRITNDDGGEVVTYAHVINSRVHGGTTSNADGLFSISMLTEDTLTIRAIGFVDYQFTVNEFPPKELYEIKLKPVRYLINEVTISDNTQLKKRLGLPGAEPLDVPIELRGSSFNKKPGVLAALLSPMSFLQYHLSDSEKAKRTTLIAIKNEKEWSEFSKYHNLENISQITGLKDDEADAFMIYCNMNNRLPYFASQMQIEYQIMDLYFQYKQMKNAEAEADSANVN